jgi:hypothetical protein
VFAQAIVARAHPTDSAKRVFCPHTLLSSLGNEISPLSHPYVSAGAGYKHLRGERRTMTSLNIGPAVYICVSLFGGCARVRPLCAHRPTWRPKWTQRSNLAEQTAFARRQTPTHSPPLRLGADKDTRSPFATRSRALHPSPVLNVGAAYLDATDQFTSR